MRRLSTIQRDLANAVADLEMYASAVEDRAGMVPGRAHVVGQIMAAAGDVSRAAHRLDAITNP